MHGRMVPRDERACPLRVCLPVRFDDRPRGFTANPTRALAFWAERDGRDGDWLPAEVRERRRDD